MSAKIDPKTVCASTAQELMGSCPLHPWPSWRDCEEGKLFGVLPLGDDLPPPSCPTYRDVEKAFPPRDFLRLLERKAGIKIPKGRVEVTDEGIYIRGGDELGLLLETLEDYWPNQKYWARPGYLWLLPK